MIRTLRHTAGHPVYLKNNAAHQFAAQHALCHYRSRSIYSFIPKNACSTMRLSIAIANGAIRGPEEHAFIHANNPTFAAELRDLVTAGFSFVILRDPLERLASVYLDKIVGVTPEFWQLHSRLGHEGNPEDMTFRRFVDAIALPGILRSNPHWRPQVDFLVYDVYDLYIQLPELNSHREVLRERAGLELHDARPMTRHGTDQYTLVDDNCFADIEPVAIREMYREGKCPAHRALFDSSLREKARQLYAQDFRLMTERFAG